eukprot:gnl/TRDRNA2_/TRDRNA2_176743_c0_seq10.p1 gnl/TRDRNA2_/TRDRNA2_176743_c0~~gnl/TRDRNA2_/TRDRNA2_176743_c0_seq10.p1  ORF type:complete len:186 (-),score=30.56 gnl/TRDRNA2_/TRDRNA2_176743_c0_seq10:158-658(-)
MSASPSLVQPMRGRRGTMPDLGAASSEAVCASAQAQNMQMSASSSLELSPLTLIPFQVERIGLDGVKLLLTSLGVKVSEQGRQELWEKVKSLNEADPRGLDFPDFLRLIRWLLDRDFCGINSAAARRVETSKHGDAVVVSIATLASLPAKLGRSLAGTTGRRRSVG